MSSLVTPSILSTPISFFEEMTETGKPKTGTFLQIVTSKKLANQYGDLIARIRSEPDKKKRTTLKEKLPCFTPSGTFSYKNEAGLIRHSGLIQFDIDPKENPWLNAQNAPAFRDEIAKFPSVAYCALSASGKGVWGVVPIAYPDRHEEHYEAFISDWGAWGINIDTKVKSFASYRFWSYDPEAKINHAAEVYSKLPDPKPEQKKWTDYKPLSPGEVADAAQYLIDTRAAVAFDYDDYLRIAAACKNEWGDEGEEIALAILDNSPAFQVSNFKRKFAAHWRSLNRTSGKRATGKALVEYADSHKEQAADTWQTFTPQQGTPFEQKMGESYPAIFDDPRPAAEAIAANIRHQTVFHIPERDCSTPAVVSEIDTRGMSQREKKALAATLKSYPNALLAFGHLDLIFDGINPLHN